MPDPDKKKPKMKSSRNSNLLEKLDSLLTADQIQKSTQLTLLYQKELEAIELIFEKEKEFPPEKKQSCYNLLLNLPTFEILNNVLLDCYQRLDSSIKKLNEQKAQYEGKLAETKTQRNEKQNGLNTLVSKINESNFETVLAEEKDKYTKYKENFEAATTAITKSESELKAYFLTILPIIKQYGQKFENYDQWLESYNKIKTDLEKPKSSQLQTARVFLKNAVDKYKQLSDEEKNKLNDEDTQKINDFDRRLTQHDEILASQKEAIVTALQKDIGNLEKASQEELVFQLNIDAINDELKVLEQHINPLKKIFADLQVLTLTNNEERTEPGKISLDIDAIFNEDFIKNVRDPAWRKKHQASLISLDLYLQKNLTKLPEEYRVTLSHLTPDVLTQRHKLRLIKFENDEKLNQLKKSLTHKCQITPQSSWIALEKHYESFLKSQEVFGFLRNPWNKLIADFQDTGLDKILKNPKGFRYLQYDYLYKAVNSPEECIRSLQKQIPDNVLKLNKLEEEKPFDYAEKVRLLALSGVQQHFSRLGLKLSLNIEEDLQRYVYHTSDIVEVIQELQASKDSAVLTDLDSLLQLYQSNIDKKDIPIGQRISEGKKALLTQYNKLGLDSPLRSAVEERQTLKKFLASELPVQEKAFLSFRLYNDGHFSFKCVGGVTPEQYQKFFLSAFKSTDNPDVFKLELDGNTYQLILNKEKNIENLYLVDDNNQAKQMNLSQVHQVVTEIATQFSIECIKSGIKVFNGIHFVNLEKTMQTKHPKLVSHVQDCANKQTTVPVLTKT